MKEKKIESERDEDERKQNKKWIESLGFEHLLDEERRTVKNGGKSSQICSRKRLGSITEALQLNFSSWKRVFLPKIAEMHSLGVMNIFLKQPPSPMYREKGRRLPPRGFLRKISKRTPITKFTPLFVLYGKVTKALRKCFGFYFHLFFFSL